MKKRHIIKVDGRSLPVMSYSVIPTTTGSNPEGSPADTDYEIRIHFPEIIVRCHLDDHEIFMPIPKAAAANISRTDIREITTEHKTRRGPGDYHPENGGIRLATGEFIQCHCGVLQLEQHDAQRYAEILADEREEETSRPKSKKRAVAARKNGLRGGKDQLDEGLTRMAVVHVREAMNNGKFKSLSAACAHWAKKDKLPIKGPALKRHVVKDGWRKKTAI